MNKPNSAYTAPKPVVEMLETEESEQTELSVYGSKTGCRELETEESEQSEQTELSVYGSKTGCRVLETEESEQTEQTELGA